MKRDVKNGVTLVELMVVILLLGLLAGVVGLTIGSTPQVRSLDPATAAVLQARDSALRTGHPVTIALYRESRADHATAYPDGRVLTDVPMDVDALSGSVNSDAMSPTSERHQREASNAER
jgi:prepilin-type N-terminal cleavage/methylation domain-containing protein